MKKEEDKIIGQATVTHTFKFKVGQIAGCIVNNGKIKLGKKCIIQNINNQENNI